MPNEQYKKLSIDALIGQVIKKVTYDKNNCVLTMKDGTKYDIRLEDDGGGTGNDSYAYFSAVALTSILHRKIISAEETNDDSYGAVFVIKTKNAEGAIVITHEHNGYYGWSYELFKSNP